MCDLIFEGLDLVMTFDTCGHSMHDPCSDQWLARNNKHCPICRSTQSTERPTRFVSKSSTAKSPAVITTPNPSPSPVSSPFTETPFSSIDHSLLPPINVTAPTLSYGDVVSSLAELQRHLFTLQQQVQTAFAHVQDLTQQLMFSDRFKELRQADDRSGTSRTLADSRKSIENLVITSFDGKPLPLFSHLTRN